METHAIAIFDCCRGKMSQEMMGTGPHFQLSIVSTDRDLSKLKNAEMKNSYILHATLPNQVRPEESQD